MTWKRQKRRISLVFWQGERTANKATLERVDCPDTSTHHVRRYSQPSKARWKYFHGPSNRPARYHFPSSHPPPQTSPPSLQVIEAVESVSVRTSGILLHLHQLLLGHRDVRFISQLLRALHYSSLQVTVVFGHVVEEIVLPKRRMLAVSCSWA